MTYDGLVSRTVNRRLSRPLARVLARTPVSPNGVTFTTLLLAFAAAAMVAFGWHIAGGIAIQLASIADGVDGELARLKGVATRLGAVLDAVTDRYADAAIVVAMTVFAWRFEPWPHSELVGMLALGGVLTVSYSRARIEASLGTTPPANLDAVFGLASRDVRLLLAAVGTALGQCYWTLAALGVLSAATVAWRLVYLRAKGIGCEPLPSDASATATAAQPVSGAEAAHRQPD